MQLTLSSKHWVGIGLAFATQFSQAAQSQTIAFVSVPPRQAMAVRQEMKLKDIELGSNNSLCVTTSNDKFGLLGVDGLIRILNTNGDILSVFGKDKDEERQFWGNTIHVSSEINRIKFSPNCEYLISGDKNGKVIIWRYEK